MAGRAAAGAQSKDTGTEADERWAEPWAHHDSPASALASSALRRRSPAKCLLVRGSGPTKAAAGVRSSRAVGSWERGDLAARAAALAQRGHARTDGAPGRDPRGPPLPRRGAPGAEHAARPSGLQAAAAPAGPRRTGRGGGWPGPLHEGRRTGGRGPAGLSPSGRPPLRRPPDPPPRPPGLRPSPAASTCWERGTSGAAIFPRTEAPSAGAGAGPQPQPRVRTAAGAMRAQPEQNGGAPGMERRMRRRAGPGAARAGRL